MNIIEGFMFFTVMCAGVVICLIMWGLAIFAIWSAIA